MPFGRPRLDGRPCADVSVVVPVYNHDRWVGEAVRSALAQTVRPREIVCIDDGSSDGSRGILEELARHHEGIRFWSRPNRGAHATLNEGVRAAVGRHVAILNSDDVYLPGRLARCLAVLDRDPELDLVATGIAFVDGEGSRIANPWYEWARQFHEGSGDLGLALVNGNFLMTTSNLVVRRSLFDMVGDFAGLRYAHDLDFFLRLCALGRRVTVLPGRLLRYRMHGSNTISEAHENVRLEWAAVAALFARRVALEGDAVRRGAGYRERLDEILERHGLRRAVRVMCHRLEAFREQLPAAEALLADPGLRAAVREVL